MDNNNKLVKYSNSNRFDKDIIKEPSSKINQCSSSKINTDYFNEYDEDNNLNLNININNYLSKNNINSNIDIPNSYSMSSRESQIPKSNILLKKHNTNNYLKSNLTKKLNNNNVYNKRKLDNNLKSKLLTRIQQQKPSLNNFDLKNNNIKQKSKEILLSKNTKDKNDKFEKNEKEESKNVPKILTFLRTFKNLALPMKINDDKQENENFSNTQNNLNSNSIGVGKEFSINPNNSCFNFNSKIKPKIDKLNLNQRNNDMNVNNNKFITDENIILKDNNNLYEVDDLIDYNRFTFRNNNGNNENSTFKALNQIKNKNDNKKVFNPSERNLYEYNDKNDFDNDMNKNINIDEYNKKYNKYNNPNNKANIKKRYMRKIQTKKDDINSNLKIDEISPKFNQRNNIANNYFNNKYNDNAYTKISLKKNYDSPQPEPKKKTNNNSIYSYNNLSNNMKIATFDNNNKSEDSFQSLNISKRYRKPIVINNFRIKNIKNNKENPYYNNNDISADEINLYNNRYSSKRPFKNNKIHEIKININDSLDSYNKEPNYYTNNYLDSKKSPLKRKNNSYYINSSPFTSNKLNEGDVESDNIDTSRIDEDENKMNSNKNFNNNNTIFLRFMKPFQRNENKKWYNEDSYFSFDIINMNKIPKNKKLLYQKPLGTRPRHMNKNNSMFISKINMYNKNDSHKSFCYENNPNNVNYINKYKNKNDYTDYDEKENNVYDFDAPKAIKDFSIDDSNNTEIINDSARENQFSVNSDINTNKLNDSTSNNNLESDNSNNNNNKNNHTLSKKIGNKMVYMKKLNTVYNFYQGTKKLFSNINNKVFKLNKKDEKKINNNQSENNNILKKKCKYKNNENNCIKKNDLLIYQGEITPRGREENEENNTSFYTKKSIGTPMVDDKVKNQLNHAFIKIKIKNQKSQFNKFYSYYLPKINHNIACCYISKAFNSNKFLKIPKASIYYMSKQNLKICKLPLQNNKCYFQKHYIVKTINKSHQKFVSFFSLGDNFIINNDSDSPLKNNKKENFNNNYKIVNLKNNIFSKDAQINLILSNDFKENENVDIHYGNSFSFKDNKNIINSNNINHNYISNDYIEINNFNFSLTPKTVQKFNDYEKIKPQKKENIMIINSNKNIKYEYEYILSLRENEYCINNNLLPKEVIEHFDNINKETDIIKLQFKDNDITDENQSSSRIPQKKLKKEEIQKLINKKNLTPNKSDTIKIIFNKNFLTEKNERKHSNYRDKADNDDMENGNSDVKLKLEWVRNDLSKEIEQAEKYIQEMKKKMEENTKRNDIIGLLNMLTVDNMNNILNKILILVSKNKEEELLPDKDIVCNEYILIKIIVDKAITEKRFVNLYAKLSYELFQKLNDIKYNNINFKKILMEECKVKFNELNNIKIDENNDINNDDEKNYLIKIKFLGNIDLICELINVNILNHDIGFYYLKELFNKYYYINNNADALKEIEKFKKYLCLEAIVNFLSKFGKKIYESKNINSFKCLNYFIDNDLNSILKIENLPGFIKYKIINLIEKQKNKWEDSLFEKSILVKGKDNYKKFNRSKKNSISLSRPHRIRKRRHSNKSLMSISPDNYISNKNSPENDNYTANNTYKNNTKRDTINYLTPLFDKMNININNNNEDIIKLIEKDIEKYEMFLKINYITNEEQLNENTEIGNEFDWSMIEGILSKSNIDLGEVIRCYIEVCIDQITNNAKIFIANDYIKNIVYYYSTNLTNKEKDIIHNKMITIFMNIQDICIDNFIMKEIMGYLIFILIENKLYYIKDLNNFINLDKEIIITIAEVIKYAIISSGLKCKKYHNDFKQTKLFVDNSIFNEYVTNSIKEHLN